MLNWNEFAKGVLRSEMAKHRVSYADLAAKLGELGIEESVPNLRNKVSRGSFTAAFLFQCLKAMRVTMLHLD